MTPGAGRRAGALALALATAPALGCRRETPTDAGAESTTAFRLDNFGYRRDDPKVAVFSGDPGPVVEVHGAAGRVFSVPADGGSVEGRGRDAPSGDTVFWVDFTRLETPGAYRLYSPRENAWSYEFEVAPGVYGKALRAALRTFFLQRCGTAKADRHAGAWSDPRPCHPGDASARAAPGHVDRGPRDLHGGWHDAGDYNKYVSYSAANAVHFLLRAFEGEPGAFPDGALDIPESGNGVSDLLDEVRVELDFLLRMQLPDGSVLSQLHAPGFDNGKAPPSADATVRHYQDPTLESGAVFAGLCAQASRVYSSAGQGEYAETLKRAALSAWRWLLGQGDSKEKVWAAAEVFRLAPDTQSARAYVDGFGPPHWATRAPEVGQYDSRAAITYLESKEATPSVAAAMRTGIARRVEQVFAADDLHRNGMPEASYHWGSNGIRAAHGVFLLDAARLGATGPRSALECRRHALDFLHFFHGQNALGMLYLTNMAGEGGEHSSWQIFHNWFGQSQDAHSREHFLGKPAGVFEPQYPYFRGADNHGIRDDKRSKLGPAPGFVPGGPNRLYSGDASPPRGSAYPARWYRDWSDQRVWTARTWEITETSISYQGPYVALVAAFAGSAP